MDFDMTSDPHTRMDILTGERVLISPHRNKRPWQGQVEKDMQDDRPAYDRSCYLCPSNSRAEGKINPDYTESFVFVNDFSALLDNGQTFEQNEDNLFISSAECGLCKVISFSPRHDLTMAEMEVEDIKRW